HCFHAAGREYGRPAIRRLDRPCQLRSGHGITDRAKTLVRRQLRVSADTIAEPNAQIRFALRENRRRDWLHVDQVRVAEENIEQSLLDRECDGAGWLASSDAAAVITPETAIYQIRRRWRDAH